MSLYFQWFTCWQMCARGGICWSLCCHEWAHHVSIHTMTMGASLLHITVCIINIETLQIRQPHHHHHQQTSTHSSILTILTATCLPTHESYWKHNSHLLVTSFLVLAGKWISWGNWKFKKKGEKKVAALCRLQQIRLAHAHTSAWRGSTHCLQF